MDILKKFRSRSFLRKLLLGAIVVGGGLFIVLTLTLLSFAKNLPTREQILNREVTQSTRIYDRTGEILLYEISGGQKRTVVPLNEISNSVKDATISIEDKRFYEEGPINVVGIVRAFLVNLTHGGIVQGGSTITQQLAKNAFLSHEQTLTRKLKELLLAVRVDKEYTKDEILELYLNEIPYGPTIYGVETASRAYFGKSAKDLTLAESAVLASIPKAPPFFNPWGTHVAELMARKELVLREMERDGKISEAELERSLNEEVKFQPPQNKGIRAPHFVMAVQDYLVSRYGEEAVRGGGLKVVTTLDMDMQEAGEKAVTEGAARNEKNYGGKNAALVAEDPKTGQILAMVGSRDYFNIEEGGNFNVATQGLRQPGSALKPFVYLAAFEKGYVPNTVLFDVPTEFSANSACPPVPKYTDTNKKCFHPRDFHDPLGPISIRTSLAQSVNITAVKALYLVGLENAVDLMNRFGLKTLTDPGQYGLSLVLGGGAVHLYDLVGAYSGLSQDGVRHEQTMILEVRGPRGSILETFKDKNEEVFGANHVRILNDVLSDVGARSGLFQGSLNLTTFPGYDVAFKTGTSNDYVDAWAFGYTPTIVAGVWAGNNDNTPMHRQGTSILAAVPIWNAFMAQVIQKQPRETFVKPDVPTPEKPALRGEYVIDGQIHTILHWVDKADPTGPPPSNPARDGAYENWETGVQNWAKGNPVFPGGNPPPIPPSPGGGAAPTIQINRPLMGESLGGNPAMVRASILDDTNTSLIRVLWNGQVVQEFLGDFGPQYVFSWSFNPPTVGPQNTLQIEAVDSSGLVGRNAVVVLE